ncbi:MAG: basic amino acid/polyamine antiporter [Bacteroidales bacterium]
MEKQSQKLGLAGLTAIVFSSMVGGGIFAIPQNMAEGAGLGATIISWVISGFGVLCLVLTFKILADLRPDLNAGIYQYAKETCGNYVGFNIAWGYWLCAAMGNVAFAVMLNDALGYFFPFFLNYSWQTVLLGSVFIWGMFLLVASGIKEASVINFIVSLVKFLAISFIVVVMIIYAKVGALSSDFWGRAENLGSLAGQIRSTMLITLWCFIGVEGAVVVSGRAKRSSDVGKAGVIGFILALLLYLLISVLSFGILHQPELAKLSNPSVAYVLEAAVGKWGAIFVLVSIIFSIIGGWIAWTILCAQVPFTAAQVNILPRIFAHENKHGSPVYALLASSILMQIFIFIVVMAESVYLSAIEIAGVMILPSYLFSGIYLVKASYDGELHDSNQHHLKRYRVIGLLTTIYCMWLIYAGGLELFFLTSLFYLIGILFYIKARHEVVGYSKEIFTSNEKMMALIIALAAVISAILIVSGFTTLS